MPSWTLWLPSWMPLWMPSWAAAAVVDAVVDTVVDAVVVPTHDARGCRRGHCGCRLCSTAGVCRSREFWQEAVGTCGLSCQLPRRLDFFAEKSIEVGDEILGRTLFYDVTDLPRQIHGLEGSK